MWYGIHMLTRDEMIQALTELHGRQAGLREMVMRLALRERLPRESEDRLCSGVCQHCFGGDTARYRLASAVERMDLPFVTDAEGDELVDAFAADPVAYDQVEARARGEIAAAVGFVI